MTLRWSGGGEHTLEVSNANGSIYVAGDDRQDVEMIADRTIDTNGRDGFGATRRNIGLDETESADTVRICADAERCSCDPKDRCPREWWRDWGSVNVDFTVRVPKNTRLRLCTINYRNDRFAAVRVGRGGPQITFEGVNGDVHVLRGDN